MKQGNIKRNEAGKPIAVPAAIRKYSDSLLMFLLNGNRSKKYRHRTDYGSWMKRARTASWTWMPSPPT